MNVLLLGPPGVGKGTQAFLLSDRYNFATFSMGDILRDEVAKKTDLGNDIKKILDSGLLVPDHIVSDLMKKFLRKHRNNSILFDGYPRNLTQAEDLEKNLTEQNNSLKHVLEMYISENEIVKRLRARKYCPQCGRIYNDTTNPPKTNGTCDICHLKLVRRNDDDESVIRKRIQVYKNETYPLIEYYKTKSIYSQIDASGSQDQVFQKLTTIINTNAKKK
jgi:adenylate kinase